MKTTKIYLITNIDNNPHKVYIGKTSSKNNNRIWGHKTKLGKCIKWSYIDEIDSIKVKDWKPLETYWIHQFTTWGFEVTNVKKNGGSGRNFGYKQSPTTIELRFQDMDWNKTGEKISKSKKGVKLSEHHRQQLKVPKGAMSEETKQKLSLAQKGVPKTKNKKSVVQLGEDGKFIKEWKSQTEAGLSLGIKQGDISSVVHGKQNTAGGYKWLLKKDYEKR